MGEHLGGVDKKFPALQRAVILWKFLELGLLCFRRTGFHPCLPRKIHSAVAKLLVTTRGLSPMRFERSWRLCTQGNFSGSQEFWEIERSLKQVSISVA